jgi:uncharacterized protein with ATP-grasp and redox domains
MKTHVECLPCFLRQSLQVARICGCSPDTQLEVVKRVAAIVTGLDVALSPPANARQVYRLIADITGCEDPYLAEKRVSNEQAKKILPSLRHEIAGAAEELSAALCFAIAGNVIDYGAYETFDIDKALDSSRKKLLTVDHSGLLIHRIANLDKGAKVLYLADNSGEIVYDSLLIEYLFRQGLEITVAVKDGPIINDALLEDALFAGLDRYARIISNGSRCPGTVLAECSPEFLRIFESADLVISKGQGNFESLSEAEREIFFLLTLKCAVAARHMAELVGMDRTSLPGKGEMAVYYSAKKTENGRCK